MPLSFVPPPPDASTPKPPSEEKENAGFSFSCVAAWFPNYIDQLKEKSEEQQGSQQVQTAKRKALVLQSGVTKSAIPLGNHWQRTIIIMWKDLYTVVVSLTYAPCHVPFFNLRKHHKITVRCIFSEGSTEEMPENVHFCIQKAATHSHFIQLTPFQYPSVLDIESYPSMCPVLSGSLCVLRQTGFSTHGACKPCGDFHRKMAQGKVTSLSISAEAWQKPDTTPG